MLYSVIDVATVLGMYMSFTMATLGWRGTPDSLSLHVIQLAYEEAYLLDP